MAGGAIWLNPFATVLFSVCSAVIVECCVWYVCCYVRKKAFSSVFAITDRIPNLFLTAQSTQIKSVISGPIKDCIHHYPRALFKDIPMVGAYFYDIPGSILIGGICACMRCCCLCLCLVFGWGLC